AAYRADVEIAGQPLVGVTEGDAVVDGLDDGCEVRSLRPNTDAGTAAEVVTAGPTAVAVASAGNPAARIDAARASRWSAVDGVDEVAVALGQRQRPVERMGDALPDRPPPVARRLHINMESDGVDIGPGADLQQVETLQDVLAVEPEIGCSEI